MKILVIGGSGHIGSYLVRELVKKGYTVYAVMRGNRTPYGYEEEVWDKVHIVQMSRAELYESSFIEELNAEVVCDLIAFDLEEVKKIVSKIKNDAFYIQIGSIWTYENKMYMPVDEEHPKNSLSAYGKAKGEIEEYLLTLAREKKLRATVIHPGHISGKEWQPINPQGNLDITVFEKLKKGGEIVLPYLGLTTLQHIHSYDLAQIIIACMEKQGISNGEAFIAVAEKALTNRAICENLYAYYGQKPNLRFVEWAEFEEVVGKGNADVTYDHAYHSPCCSVEKAKQLLGVEIKYSIMDIFKEYLEYQNM